MEFSLFLVLAMTAGAAVTGFIKPLLAILLPPVRRKHQTRLFWALTLGFFALLVAALALYLPHANDIWYRLGSRFDEMALVLNLPGSHPLRDLYGAVQFFRVLYPGALAAFAVLTVMGAFRARRVTFWYRLTRRFDHRLALVLPLPWGLTVLAERFHWLWLGPETLWYFFNAALYFSAFYVVLGFLQLEFGLLKNGLPRWAAMAILTLGVVITGWFFPVALVFLLGIGVSDVWMLYGKRRTGRLSPDENDR